MTDETRQLIIQLVSHMSYMQGQLEGHHPLDDFDDYHWYRESVRLRSMAAEVLA